MTKYISMWAFALALIGVISCSESNEIIEKVEIVELNPNAKVNDFIWTGMNDIYLWQGDVPILADDRFASQEEYEAYLQASEEPESFFYSLLYDRQNVDFFSFFVDDYNVLEDQFQGISLSNGVDFGLTTYGSDDKVLGYIRLILPDSDADGKNIKRGDVFTEVDGEELTLANYRSLLFSDNTTYTLAISEIIGNTITPTGNSVELTKTNYTEPSVNKISIIEEVGRKIGYIHYTQFSSQESELNAAFLQLKNSGVTDLIVDLRYNGGGFDAVETAMATMITGQFKGQVYGKTIWNSKYQEFFEAEDPGSLQTLFDDKTSGSFSDETINSLNLSSVHIIGLSRTASASESLINGLQPYIDVTLVGEVTFGKYTGSITIYDSEAIFSSEGANPNHTYAIQPIIYRFSNRDGGSPQGGLQPDILISEDLGNMGVIGNSNEPLLRAAINDIIGISAKAMDSKTFQYEKITDYRLEQKFGTSLIATRPEIQDAMKKMQSKK